MASKSNVVPSYITEAKAEIHCAELVMMYWSEDIWAKEAASLLIRAANKLSEPDTIRHALSNGWEDKLNKAVGALYIAAKATEACNDENPSSSDVECFMNLATIALNEIVKEYQK